MNFLYACAGKGTFLLNDDSFETRNLELTPKYARKMLDSTATVYNSLVFVPP